MSEVKIRIVSVPSLIDPDVLLRADEAEARWLDLMGPKLRAAVIKADIEWERKVLGV